MKRVILTVNEDWRRGERVLGSWSGEDTVIEGKADKLRKQYRCEEGRISEYKVTVISL